MAGPELPPMALVRQRFPREHIADVRASVAEALRASGLPSRLRPGARIAVTVGSRGIAQLPAIVGAAVATLRELGAEPFVVPAMGSHGGATAEGQREVLEGYGVTAAAVEAPILATMDVVEVGRTAAGVPVYTDRHAWEADGVLVFGRVKAHTAFKAPIESGLCKMLAVGLGKQRGAETLHGAGLAQAIPDVARVLLGTGKVVGGLAVVENAADDPYRIEAVPPEAFPATDEALLRLSNSLLPRIPFDHLDVLVVDWIGKNLSGSGMDPNVIGMWRRLGGERRPDYRRIVVRDVTPESHGNAIGIGWADFTTRRLVDSIDYGAMYMNCLTANAPDVARIPMTMATDREALEAAAKTSGAAGPLRIVRVHSTLRLEEMYVSQALLPEVEANPGLEVLAPPAPLLLDDAGHLGPAFLVK